MLGQRISTVGESTTIETEADKNNDQLILVLFILLLSFDFFYKFWQKKRQKKEPEITHGPNDF